MTYMGKTVVQAVLTFALVAATLLVRRRATGHLPGLLFWVACLFGVIAIGVGTTVDVSGVLLAVPVIAVAGLAIVRGGWRLGDSGLFLIVLGVGTAVAYVIEAAIDPDTGSFGDQGAFGLVVVGAVVCLIAMALSFYSSRTKENDMAAADREREGLAWQTGVWDRMSDVYVREIDRRFEPVVDGVIGRAALEPGEHVLDLGTGTGAVAERAAPLVRLVTGVDISADMLAQAQQRIDGASLANVELREGRAEEIPGEDGAYDAVLASLSMMYVIDRAAAAREIARVLRPGGRFVASVWAGPERCDIVLFQQTAGRFGGTPPVAGVGPGALADPREFLQQLEAAGITTRVETETLGFDFPDFASAWDTLAGVTTADLPAERRQEAKDAVLATMYPDGDGQRHFRNATQFLIGTARA
jgi:SAM-dependent methyltransferase